MVKKTRIHYFSHLKYFQVDNNKSNLKEQFKDNTCFHIIYSSPCSIFRNLAIIINIM